MLYFILADGGDLQEIAKRAEPQIVSCRLDFSY